MLSQSFERWPRWMWANTDIVELVEWLKDYNKGKPEIQQVGFYGLDVYSLWESLDLLTKVFESDPKTLEQIYRTYACFEPYDRDEQQYAQATRYLNRTCEDTAVELLRYLLEAHQHL